MTAFLCDIPHRYPVRVDVHVWHDIKIPKPDALSAFEFALQYGAPIACIGGPGSGKTAGLKAVTGMRVTAVSDGRAGLGTWLPVYVDLALWAGKMLEEILECERPTIVPTDNRVLWLLDNLDLHSNKVSIIRHARMLQGSTYRFAIATRPEDSLLRVMDDLHYTRLQLCSLNSRDRFGIVSRQFPSLAGAYGKFEKDNPSRVRLMRSPLSFSMVLETLSDNGAVLPGKNSGRSGILADYVTFSVNRAAEAGRITQEEREQWSACGHKAVSRMYWGKLTRGLVPAECGSDSDPADLGAGIGILLKAGILTEGDGGRPEIAHRQLAEHFAACRLAEILESARSDTEFEDALWRCFRHQDLDEVLAQALSILESRRPGTYDDMHQLVVHEVVSAPCVVGLIAKTLDVRASEIPMRYLVEKGGAEQLRLQAIAALGEIGDQSAVPALIKALHDNDINVCLRAAWALGKIGDLGAVSALLESAQETTRAMCISALDALGEIGDQSAVPVLLKSLLSCYDYSRTAAARALGKIGDRTAVLVLIERLKSPHKADRDKAVNALEELGDPRAVPRLTECLNDEDHWVRGGAARLLGDLKSRRSVPALLSCVKDRNPMVRENAIASLGKLGDPAAFTTLIACLRAENASVRRAAAAALEDFGDICAVPALIESLNDTDCMTRQSTARTLGKLEDRSAVSALLDCLAKEKDYYVHLSAFEALRRLREPNILGVLSECLRNSDPKIRWYAAYSLGRLGEKEAVPALIGCLGDEEDYVRQYAAEALGKLGDTEAVSALIERLHDREPDVRGRAAAALGELRAHSAVADLEECLNDVEDSVRWRAARALGKIADRNAVPALVAGLKDRDWYVRCNSAKALAVLGSKAAVRGLVESLRDGDDLVRQCAVEAIGDLGAPDAIRELVGYYRASAGEERWIATKAISAVVFRNGVSIERLLEMLAAGGVAHLECTNLLGFLGRRVRKADYEKLLEARQQQAATD